MKKLIELPFVLALVVLSMQAAAQGEYQTKGSGDSKKGMKNQTTTTMGTNPAQSSQPADLKGQSEKTPAPSTGTTTTTTKPSGTTTTYTPSGTVTSATSGRSGKMNDAQGNLLMYIDQGGYIRNPKHRLVGQYVNGEYFGKNRVKVATMNDGVVRDKNGREIARIGKDGKVTDGDGKLLGAFTADGTVTDAKGLVIGSAPGVDRQVAAVVYFFKLVK